MTRCRFGHVLCAEDATVPGRWPRATAPIWCQEHANFLETVLSAGGGNELKRHQPKPRPQPMSERAAELADVLKAGGAMTREQVALKLGMAGVNGTFSRIQAHALTAGLVHTERVEGGRAVVLVAGPG